MFTSKHLLSFLYDIQVHNSPHTFDKCFAAFMQPYLPPTTPLILTDETDFPCCPVRVQQCSSSWQSIMHVKTRHFLDIKPPFTGPVTLIFFHLLASVVISLNLLLLSFLSFADIVNIVNLFYVEVSVEKIF